MAKSSKTTRKSKSSKAGAKAKAGKAARKTKATRARTKSKSGSTVKTRSRQPSQKTKSAKPVTEAPKALRLTFSYDGDKVKLIGRQSVEMKVPPSDPVKGFKKQKGFWAEVKGAQDRTLFRRVMHNPTRNDAEVFSDDPYEGISREPAPTRKGVFVVVVPDTDKGRDLVLARSSGPPPRVDRRLKSMRSLAAAPATEIARFKLRK